MTATITSEDMVPGTVYTFVKNMTFLDCRWASRTPGTHFVVVGMSESGYTFGSINTRTGRRDDTMAESWVFEAMRIVGRPAACRKAVARIELYG